MVSNLPSRLGCDQYPYESVLIVTIINHNY